MRELQVGVVNLPTNDGQLDLIYISGGGAGGGASGLALFSGVPYADGAANSGVMTENYDSVNKLNFIRWTSASATQDYNYRIAFMIPSGFRAFPANAVSIGVRTNDKDNNVITMTMIDGAGNADAGINGVSLLPSANDTWQTKTDTPTATYTAGDWCAIDLHLGNSAASDTVDISRFDINFD